MRSYQIEDLLPENVRRIEARLAELGHAGGMEGIFYLPVPETLLSPEQKEHAAECGPHILALETDAERGRLKLELLVRARGRLRCSCVAYASPALREYMIGFLDQFIRDLDIPV